MNCPVVLFFSLDWTFFTAAFTTKVLCWNPQDQRSHIFPQLSLKTKTLFLLTMSGASTSTSTMTSWWTSVGQTRRRRSRWDAETVRQMSDKHLWAAKCIFHLLSSPDFWWSSIVRVLESKCQQVWLREADPRSETRHSNHLCRQGSHGLCPNWIW